MLVSILLMVGSIIDFLLEKRGILTPEAKSAFLNPKYDSLSDPFSMHDMQKAVDSIKQAISENKKIAIYSDYDADGIPGAVVLFEYFKFINYTNIVIYIPHRHNEGYGVHKEALKKLQEEGVDLVITVDVGITAVNEIEYGKSLGLEVIVTDHHEPLPEIPDCLLVHPKLGDTYNDPMICGCATAFQLVRALSDKSEEAIKFEKWLLDLVGIATIGDMVPLVNENRILSYFGMTVLRKTKRLGLRALYEELKITPSELTETDLGFSIIPRLNAAGRMKHPKHAFDLLVASTSSEAKKCAQELSELNTKRKNEVTSIVKKANKIAKKLIDAPVLVVGELDWNVGVVGIVAGKLVEEYNKPTFVWTGYEGEFLKGSCRGNGTVSVVDMMQSCSELFSYFGGHAEAGGFTLPKKNIQELEKRLCEFVKTIPPNLSENRLPTKEGGSGQLTVEGSAPLLGGGVGGGFTFDLELQLSDITFDLYNDLEKLAPYGVGNPRPQFLFRNILVSDKKFLGQGEKHLKFALRQAQRPNSVEMVDFNISESHILRTLEIGDTIDIIGAIELNNFMGRKSLRIKPVEMVKK